MTALPLTTPSDSLRQALLTIQQDGRGIALLLPPDGRLAGVVTDGDVRRAFLAGMGLETTVAELLAARTPVSPVTARAGTSREALVGTMRGLGIRQLPLVDAAGLVVGLATLDELAGESQPLAVLMAGGRGERLRPMTDDCPKPMLSIGGRPLLEHTIARLRQAGITRVNITTRYLGDQIEAHFGDGDGFGVEVRYTTEDQPLGTAGALGLIDHGSGPLLVSNADLLTTIDYGAFLRYHRAENADLTVAVRREEWPIKSGVVEVSGGRVVEIIEKPMAGLLINAGIYLVEPYVAERVRVGRCDMPHVIEALLRMGRPVVAFPLVLESWADIGTADDYARVQGEVE